jgi:U3 small nucleolar RNA-associated protein 5
MPTSTKRKAPARVAAPVVKAAANVPRRSMIDESKASVAGTETLQSSKPDTIEISSDEDSEEDVSDEEAAEEEAPRINGQKDSTTVSHSHLNGISSAKQLVDEEAQESGSDEEPTSPSFGELLRDNGAIDVPSLLQQSSTASNLAVQQSRTAIVAPSHESLTTVLSQALKTDDTDLLESCLHTTSLPTIRNTIENIDSALAGTLLTKLASRLHRRPGRAGNLMTWVQWTLIAHGGALASQPKVVSSLAGLQKVLSERAKGLNSLLALKGKLDLLEGQMDMRKRIQKRSNLLEKEGDDEDDENVIWVEGESEEAGDLANGIGSRRKRNAGIATDDDDDDDEPAINGFGGDSDDDEEESDVEEDEDDAGDSQDEGDQGSDLAEEESLDEDEVDHDDVDESMGEGEDEESDVDADAAPPSKMQKVTRLSAPKRK